MTAEGEHITLQEASRRALQHMHDADESRRKAAEADPDRWQPSCDFDHEERIVELLERLEERSRDFHRAEHIHVRNPDPYESCPQEPCRGDRLLVGTETRPIESPQAAHNEAERA